MKNRLLPTLLAVCVAVGLFSGCGRQSQTPVPQPELPVQSEPLPQLQPESLPEQPQQSLEKPETESSKPAPEQPQQAPVQPGLPKVPAAEKIDVDENGKIDGLF